MEAYIIYKATSPSNKVYLGMTKKSLNERRKEHEWHSKSNKNKKIFHCALQKYELDFLWEVLKSGLTKEEAENKEIEYIAQFNATDRNFGYNQAKGGLAGDIMPEESRARWKQSMKQYYDNPEYCKRISAHLKETRIEGFKNWLASDSKEVKEWKSSCSNRMKKLSNDRSSKLKRALMRGGKPFICVETGEKFELLQDAADRFGVDKRNIHSVLKHPERYKTILRKYTFIYI